MDWSPLIAMLMDHAHRRQRCVLQRFHASLAHALLAQANAHATDAWRAPCGIDGRSVPECRARTTSTGTAGRARFRGAYPPVAYRSTMPASATARSLKPARDSTLERMNHNPATDSRQQAVTSSPENPHGAERNPYRARPRQRRALHARTHRGTVRGAPGQSSAGYEPRCRQHPGAAAGRCWS